MNVSQKLIDIFKYNNIKPILVGGLVRDRILSLDNKDIDIEIYGNDLTYDKVVDILQDFNPKIVGKQFGVIKINIDNIEYDISFPRTETSNGQKHTEFDINIDSTLDYQIAFKRRDFTMNSIGINLITNEYIDLYNGINDINHKIIKHVDSESFKEDPLRIFRAIQFSSRLEFNIHEDTDFLIKEMINNNMLNDLPKERIFTEFNKMLLKSKKPSIGINLMKQYNILNKYFHEISNISDITLFKLDKIASTSNNLMLIYTILCSELNKNEILSFMSKLTNKISFIDNIVKYNQYIEIPYSFLKRIKNGDKIETIEIIDIINDINNSSYFHKNFNTNDSLNDLIHISSIYYMNNNILKHFKKYFNYIFDIDFSPLVNGNDLIKLGIQPGHEFKKTLEELYIYQINNNIKNKNDVLKFLD